MDVKTVVLLVVLAAVRSAYGARILALFPHVGRSHFMVFEPLLKALDARGHEMVVVSHFPQRSPPSSRWTDVSLVGSLVDHNGSFDVEQMPITGVSGVVDSAINYVQLNKMGNDSCEAIYAHPPLRDFIANERRGFDLIVTEAFSTNCVLGLVHRFRPAPYIGMSSCAPFSWDLSRVGSPVHYAVMPQTLLWMTDDMTLWERVVNTVFSLVGRGIGALYWDREAQRVLDKYLGPGVPPLEDIAYNMSLLLTNTHPALNGPRPLAPSVVEVGGLHLSKVKPLPKGDLEKFVTEAKDGLIVFSLGSMIRTSAMPKDKAVALLEAFGTLKQRVVWKWEGKAPGPVPSNVLLSKWLPQFDVVCHNNTRLFIGHGGLLSTTEAAHCGVPMLGVAVYGDQHTNMAAISRAGSGRSLPYSTLKDANLFIEQVRDILENPSYSENAKLLSARFNDRPMSAIDTAVYWTEHVIQHRGAPHLQGAARRLYWHQELLLDVLAVVLLGAAAVVAVLTAVLRTLVKRVGRLVGGSAGDRAKSAKKQKRS